MTIDSKVEVFFRMFAGMGVNEQFSVDLAHNYAVYEEELREDRKKPGQRPFLKEELPKRDKGKLIEVLEDIKKSPSGPHLFIPGEDDEEYVRIWNQAHSTATATFLEKIDAIVEIVTGKRKSQYERYYIRNEAEKRATLRAHVSDYASIFGPKAKKHVALLRAAEALDPHIAEQPLDMTAYLRKALTNRSTYVDGIFIRNKSADRLARKVAQNIVDGMQRYDEAKHEAKQKKRSGEIDPEAVSICYKDFLVTDQLAFLLLFGEGIPLQYDFMFTDGMGFRQLEKIDASTAKIQPDFPVHQHRLKIFFQREAYTFDLHVDDLASFLAMQYGKTAHHRMVYQQHTQALSNPKYGHLYRHVYERAYRFFRACEFPKIEPKLFAVYADTSVERQKTLTQLRQRILERIDYQSDDVNKLVTALTPDTSITRKREQERQLQEAEQRLLHKFERRFDNRFSRLKTELEFPIYQALIGHGYALSETMQRGSESLFEYGSFFSPQVKIRHQPEELLQHANFLAKLYWLFYKDDPIKMKFVEQQRNAISAYHAGLTFLIAEQEPYFKALNEAIDYLDDKGYEPTMVREQYREVSKLFDAANKAIASSHTPYNPLASLKLEVRMRMGTHLLHFQNLAWREITKLMQDTEDTPMDGNLYGLFIAFRNRMDTFFYACKTRLSTQVTEMYLKEREQLDKILGIDKRQLTFRFF
ncbi:hypothetical protein HY488_01360 [Candidatus Woesearchaeota archaeon]|nr:hypothetical protein [Candidatus Woesearchaeota archaeon]